MSPGPVRWRIWSPRFARPCGKACKRPGVAVLKSGLHSGWKNNEILRSTMKSQWICSCLRFDNLLHVWRGGPQPWERWRTWCVYLTTVNECQNHGVTKQNIALSNIYPSTALGYDSAGACDRANFRLQPLRRSQGYLAGSSQWLIGWRSPLTGVLYPVHHWVNGLIMS